MPSLNEVYARIQEKKKEKRDMTKSIQDALMSNARYQLVVEEIKKFKEEKKSIENQVMAAGEAEKLDVIKLHIESDRELLTDIAVNMLVANEKVEIVDDNNQRLVPAFSVTFKKDEEGSTVGEQAPKKEFAEAV
ncbi:MAG: hypothetical protein AAB692_02900 [Patescibacteria group bacterium]